MSGIVGQESISYSIIYAICESMDLTCVKLEDGSVRVDAATAVFIRISQRRDRLNLSTYRRFSDELGVEDRFHIVEKINTDSPFLKAGVTATGSIKLSHVHYIAGGVAPDNIVSVLQWIASAFSDVMFKYKGNFR